MQAWITLLTWILVPLLAAGGYLWALYPRQAESTTPAQREIEWMVFWLGLGFEDRARAHLNQSIRLRLDTIINENTQGERLA